MVDRLAQRERPGVSHRKGMAGAGSTHHWRRRAVGGNGRSDQIAALIPERGKALAGVMAAAAGAIDPTLEELWCCNDPLAVRAYHPKSKTFGHR